MIIREALAADIPQIQFVRNAVTENTLSDPSLVTDADCANFMFNRGKGWVCEIDQHVVGFSIADLQDHNIWALFVHPLFHKKGIGQLLHDTMLNWYFSQTNETVWLGTAPHTRAAFFYRKCGWQEVGMHGKNEIKFEMNAAAWHALQQNNKPIT